MEINELKQKVYEANMELVKNELVILTWGNVSMVDRKKGIMVIKPSGVNYQTMRAEDMVTVSLKSGKPIDKHLRPSSDTPTHLELYRRFPRIGGVVHTHSTFATVFAQAGMSLPPLGTTHADAFYGTIPCVEKLSKFEIEKNYEANTGKAIVATFKSKHLDYMATPAALLQSHGPFAWGIDAHEAVKNAITLEAVAKMAYLTLTLNPKVAYIDKYLSDKHYDRKHGKKAYYGQK